MNRMSDCGRICGHAGGRPGRPRKTSKASEASNASRPVLVAAVFIGAAAAVVAAEQVTVQRPRADIRDIKGSAGVVIETVGRNDKLEVLGREGHWLHVRTASGKVGYVPEAVQNKGGPAADASGVSGSATVSPTEAAAAGRGWDKEVETYASSKGLSTDGLRRMEAWRQSAAGQPLRDFEQRGGLRR